MTNTLPRPIEPGEIKVGMRVCAEANMTTVEGVVTEVADGRVRIGNITDIDRPGLWSWTLLAEPPTPAPAVGSHWRDEKADTEYIATDTKVDGHTIYNPYLHAYASAGICAAWSPMDADIIARLTPIPDHGDGYSEWPIGGDGEVTCSRYMGGYKCNRTASHDGFHAAYGFSDRPYLVWADDVQLAKRSERGQR